MACPMLLLKRAINAAIAPTWCPKCGDRLLETVIGFREQRSRYACPNPACSLHGLPLAVHISLN